MAFVVMGHRNTTSNHLQIGSRCFDLAGLSECGHVWLSFDNIDNTILISKKPPSEYQICRTCGEFKNSKKNFPGTPSGKLSTVCNSCSTASATKATANHRQRHPSHQRAREILTHALQKNRVRPGPCIIPECKKKAEGHHPNYNRPREVVWVCHEHHKAIDNNKLALPENYNITILPLIEKMQAGRKPTRKKIKRKKSFCSVQGCVDLAVSTGLCDRHYAAKGRELRRKSKTT